MGHLPHEEEEGEGEHLGIEYPAACRGPADGRRQGADESTGEDGKRRHLLQVGVDTVIPGEGE